MIKLWYVWIVILGMTFLLSCTPKKQNEIHLLPYGFKGKVTIFYNVPHGLSREVIDGSTIFRIPNNGVLVVNFPPGDGYVDTTNVKYFIETSEGFRVQLYNIGSEAGIHYQGTGVHYVDDDGANKYFYEYYIVGHSDSVNLNGLLDFAVPLPQE